MRFARKSSYQKLETKGNEMARGESCCHGHGTNTRESSATIRGRIDIHHIPMITHEGDCIDFLQHREFETEKARSFETHQLNTDIDSLKGHIESAVEQGEIGTN